METRLRKRKAEEALEHKRLQKQMTEHLNQHGFVIGPRDIVINVRKPFNNNFDTKVKQEFKVEPEVKNEFVEPESLPSKVKGEVKMESTVFVTEEYNICGEDCQNIIYGDYQIHETKTELQKTCHSSNSTNDGIHEAQLILEATRLEKNLPQKVWKRIARKLEDSDFLNLINSTQFFRKRLSKERCTFLYKPVFKVLVPTLARNSDILMKTEAQPVLLKSRTVCKKWKNASDTVISNWCNDFGQAISQKSQSLKNWLDNSYKFEALTTSFDKFLVMFQIIHCSRFDNPFVGRYINIFKRIYSTAAQSVETVWTPCTTLLEKFGHHIWTFQINISYITPHETRTQKEMVDLLHNLPNLKHLRIGYSDFGLYKDDTEDPINKQLVLPNLGSLQTLSLVAVSPGFCHRILSKSPNITCLSVTRNWCLKPDPNYFTPLRHLSKLESLQISVQSSQDIKHVHELNSPLKILILSNAKYNIIDWSKELKKICKFSKTLEVLKLQNVVHIPCDRNFLQYSCHERFDLPKLKIFHSEISNLISLDFLLEAKSSLEEIYIKTKSFGLNDETKEQVLEIEKKQIIEFLGFEDKLLESNIWRMLPKLKKISLKVNGIKTEYRREAWIEHTKLSMPKFTK